jgi:hypothetical protein
MILNDLIMALSLTLKMYGIKFLGSEGNLQRSASENQSTYIGKAHRKRCKTWAGRLAWLGHLLDVQKVAGPNPVRPTN